MRISVISSNVICCEVTGSTPMPHHLGMIIYCFIKVSDYLLVFIMVFANRFWRYDVRNVVAGYRRILLITCRVSLTL